MKPVALPADETVPFSLDAIREYRRIPPMGPVARDPAAKLGYTSFRGYYRSLLMQMRFPYESLLERDAMIVHDFDLGVRRFYAQPITLIYRREGKLRRYTPDLRVELVDYRNFLLEVRPAERTPGRLEPLLDYIRPACREKHAEHAFVDETHIRQEPFFSNCMRMRACPRFLLNDVVADVAGALRSVMPPATLGGVMAAMSGSFRQEAVLGLAALRILRVAVHKEITIDTIVDKGGRW